MCRECLQVCPWASSALVWEFMILNRWHGRFSAPGYSIGPDRIPDPTSPIPKAWDNRRYNVSDTYSSQLNSVCRKFYGWVDDCIEACRAASAVFGFIW
jgi:hypothetical protein